jgi:hypothetical protein
LFMAECFQRVSRLRDCLLSDYSILADTLSFFKHFSRIFRVSPLTKKILTQMGPEGQEILTRLKKYMYEVTTAYSKFGENKVSNIGTERYVKP